MILIFDDYKFNWTEEEMNLVKNMVKAGLRASQIAKRMEYRKKDIRLLIFWLVENGEV